MVRSAATSAAGRGGDTAVFFLATLVLWAVSVAFEISLNRRSELAAVVAGFAFFQAANFAVRSSLSRDPVFVNTAVSLLHSSIISVAVVWILVSQWVLKGTSMFDHDQLFGGTWLGAYSALCFSCGYFAYDQLDMIRFRLYSGRIPGILVHHLILLVCFTLALYRNVTINYLILTLVCELVYFVVPLHCDGCNKTLHSIFLHARKVRRMAGFRDTKSRLIKVEWALNWVTFCIARVACHILITYKVVVDAPKFGSGIELPLALFGMAGMNLLNIFLGLDLFRAYRREKNQGRRQD